MVARPWREAWQEALYGAHGFYRSAEGPAGHFTTATHGAPGAVLAHALATLADREHLRHVVDVGAGRGELLAQLALRRPDLRLTGVDVVARPAGLSPAVDWWQSPGGRALPDELVGLAGVLVVAHEWLDVVPCTVAEVDAHGALRVVHVDPHTGSEHLGDRLAGEELGWAEAHWPTTTPGERVEVGLDRDLAWDGLLRRVDSGLAVAIDYGHRAGERPRWGTLAAYRSGRPDIPVPDGRCDLTAHVAMDTLSHDELVDQRTALGGLGVEARTPDHELARREPHSYLAALARSSAASALTARGGFGDFLWAFSRRG